MALLKMKTGHQLENRQKAMRFAEESLGAARVDDATVSHPRFGLSHFSAYTDPTGAMVSTPDGDDQAFGDADWHAKETTMLFRDFGAQDQRVAIFLCSIEQLLARRGAAGQHGVSWQAVGQVATFAQVWVVDKSGSVKETKVLKEVLG